MAGRQSSRKRARDALQPKREMEMTTPAMFWTGRVLTGVFALFMLGASISPKLLGMPIAEETMAQLGWPAGYAFTIGLIELTCLVLYLVPQTSMLGAVLMMGLLGGAIATQIRAGSPLFSHVLFSVYLGLFMWGGLWLRDQRLRALFPFTGGQGHGRGDGLGSERAQSHAGQEERDGNLAVLRGGGSDRVHDTRRACGPRDGERGKLGVA